MTFYVLLLSILTWRKHGFIYMQKIVLSDSFIVFSLIFSFVFAFIIGITTANFGALVRYKIPLIPFFMASLFIIITNFNIEKDKINE
jgi:multisubunit Na+/H+ antiporter MnhE subunit